MGLLYVIMWFYMYFKRLPFILNGMKTVFKGMKPSDITAEVLARHSPPDVLAASDNLKNLFEVPPLFLIFALFLFVTGQVDAVYVTGSWFYVALRYVHSLVHCTINTQPLRFYVYCASTLVLWAMGFRAAFAYTVLT